MVLGWLVYWFVTRYRREQQPAIRSDYFSVCDCLLSLQTNLCNVSKFIIKYKIMTECVSLTSC